MNVMTMISEPTMNSFWLNNYKSSVGNLIKTSMPELNQLNNGLKSVKTLSTLSLQNFQSQQQEYRQNVIDFTGTVSRVNNSAKTLSSTNFLDQKYVTSAANVVTGQAKIGAKTAQYNVNISQVAKTQRNEGLGLTGNGYGAVGKGISTFGIKVGNGSERQVSVNVSATDNNKQVLTKFANAINKSGAGVNAEVKTKNNVQYLSIESKETGEANNFAIRDITGTSSAVLQLNNKVQDAIDAQYNVNGVEYQSSTNQVSLDNGNVSITLKGKTTGVIKVDVGKDDSKILAGAKALVASYNDLHDILSNSDTVTALGSKVLNRVESLVSKGKSGEFANMGISLDKDTGELELDEKKLSAALVSNPDKVKNLLTGGSGLAKTIADISKELTGNSVDTYLKAPNSLNLFDYGSQFAETSWAARQNSLMQGLFVNMMV